MSAASAPKYNEIGNLFASQYYRHLVSSPDTAHNFYHAEAGFSRLRGSALSEPIVGHEKIKAYIASYNYPSCRLKIDTIDSQEKGKNEIIVLVSGIEIDADQVVRPFCQTFCLEAISGTRYLVRNDVLRYLRNELLNIGEQKVDVPAETIEHSTDESAELQEEQVEQPVPVHVDMETQVGLSNIESAGAAKDEEPQLTPQPAEEQPIQIPPSQPPKHHKSSTRADTKREPADPSKPPTWSSVVGGTTSGGALNSVPASEPLVVNNQDLAASEEEIATAASTSVLTPSEKSKAAPRPEVLNSLHVSNIDPGCDVEEVKELFSRFGKVKNVKYQSPQTYCFVDFESAESVDRALKGGPLKLGSFELKLERRKTPPFNGSRGRGGRGATRGGARGRGGGTPRDSRPESRTNDRIERREQRPREGNDRSGANRSPNKDERSGRSGRGRGGGSRGGATPTAAS